MKSATILLSAIALTLAFSQPGRSADPNTLANGIDLYKHGKYANAVRVLTALVRQNQKGKSASTIYYYLGCCYYQSQQREDARKIYQTIVSQFPGSPEAPMSVAMLKQIDPSYLPAGEKENHARTVGGSSAGVGGSSAGVASTAGVDKQSSSDPMSEMLKSLNKAMGGAADEAELSKLPDQSHFNFRRGESGHMVVSAFLNNHPITCLFDTGAGAHFGLNHLRAAGIDCSKAKSAGFTHGWAGKAVPISVMDVDVRLGGMTRKCQISIEEDMHLQPLIGQEFVRGFQYEIDDGAGLVSLKKSLSSSAKQDLNSLYDLPCVVKGRDDYIPISVGGKKTEAFIDTGAFATIIHPSTLAALHIEIPPDAEITHISGVGGSLAVYKIYLDLQVGPVKKAGFPVLIGGNCGNCIGQDFMENWRIKVDRERHLLRFFH